MIARSLHEAISRTATEVLSEGRCTVQEIALRVEHGYPSLVEAEAGRLVHQHIKHIARRVMRELTEEDDQDALPGLALPVVIAVPHEDGEIRYIRTDRATWGDLQAGMWLRDENIKRAVARRKSYLATMNRLRPHMEGDPKLTVADALRLEAA